MESAKITIGITCYNEGELLLECWESVLSQIDERWLAVMVLDGGADSVTQSCFESIEHPKLKKVRLTTNLGPYKTRNIAFQHTNTPYHFYLDGDDILALNAVGLSLSMFETYPEIGYVYGDYMVFGSEKKVERKKYTYNKFDYIHGRHPPGACAYKKTVWKRLGGYCEDEVLCRGAADYDFHLGLMEAEVAGKHCGDIIYHIRRGGRSQVSMAYEKEAYVKFEKMVTRHTLFFKNRKERNRFLAVGYRRSAEAFACDDRKRARVLARKVLLLGLFWGPAIWHFAIWGTPLPKSYLLFKKHISRVISKH